MESQQYEKGLATFSKIIGEDGQKIIDALKEISPDFAELMIEFPFGDVCSRPGLDLKSREIATVASLAAMGTAPLALKVHINGALNVGCTRQEIIELMMQMAVYAGFPAAVNGLLAAKEIFDQRDADGKQRAN